MTVMLPVAENDGHTCGRPRTARGGGVCVWGAHVRPAKGSDHTWTCNDQNDPLWPALDLQARPLTNRSWDNDLDSVFGTNDTSFCGANRYIVDDGVRCLATQHSLCQVRCCMCAAYLPPLLMHVGVEYIIIINSNKKPLIPKPRACLQPVKNTQNSKPRPPTASAKRK